VESDISASRIATTLDIDSRQRRLILARVILMLGAIVELLMMAALPLDHLTATERQSAIALGAMFIVSLGAAVSLARYPRTAIVLLGAETLYSAWAIASRAANHVQFPPQAAHEPFVPSMVFGFVVAAAAYSAIPIALAIAWPMRKVK
jgi:hypothetical protein